MGSKERVEREKAEHRKKREELILSKAKALFLKKGFIAATISEIAAACELTNGAIYLYYKNKDQLVMKVMSGISSDFGELLEEAAGAGWEQTGVERLAGLLDVYNKTYSDYRNYHLLDAQFNLMFSKRYPEGPLLDEYFKANRKVLAIVTEAIAAGFEDGSINSALSAARAAGLLLNAINSYVEKISLRGDLMEQEQGIRMEDELQEYILILLRALKTA